MKFFWLLAIPLVFLSTPASAQSGLDENVWAFLQQARPLQTEAEIAVIAADHFAEMPQSDVMANALGLMRESRLQRSVRYDAVLRLLVAASAPYIEATSRPIAQMLPADVSAIQARIGYPENDDLALYFFERGPSIHLPTNGEYIIIRLAPNDAPRLVIEQSPLPQGSGFESRQRIFAADEDPVAKNESERAKTLRLNMSAVAPLVVAARSYRIAEQLPEEIAVYALLIAMEALSDSTAAHPDELRALGFTGQTTAERALAALQRDGNLSDDLTAEAEALELAFPTAAFFARQFPEAADAYGELATEPNDAHEAAWRAWGVALSRFAAGHRDPADFERLATTLSPETEQFAAIFLRFLSVLTSEDAAAFPHRTRWEDLAHDVATGASEDGPTRLNRDTDFLRLLETIARPDMALPFIMRRLESEREQPGRPLEHRYLVSLGAFTRDLCHHISFRLSTFGIWERRDELGYDGLTDFLDNLHPSGRLTVSGEVVRPHPGFVPYPATEPEEDCAVMLVASGIAPGLIGAEDTLQLAPAFFDWVSEALEREDPRPSIAPYMKLIYLDWFATAFEPLRRTTGGPVSWQYDPLGLSDLTDPAFARNLLTDEAFHPEQRRHLTLMLTVRDYLETRYGEGEQ